MDSIIVEKIVIIHVKLYKNIQLDNENGDGFLTKLNLHCFVSKNSKNILCVNNTEICHCSKFRSKNRCILVWVKKTNVQI